jgi:hypothetical protein
MNKYLLIISLLVTSTVSYADQCSVLPTKSALMAKVILSEHVKSNSIAVIDSYCESCRDETPKPIVIDSIELKDFQIAGFKEIFINNKKIDLAYIYLEGVSIAGKIGCKAFGISKYL